MPESVGGCFQIYRGICAFLVGYVPLGNDSGGAD